MTFVVGRDSGLDAGPTCRLGGYRARDGSCGAPLHVDLDGPHVGLVVGKRGYGKSYTLGVLAEALARAEGIAPVVVDPMGAFDGLAAEAEGGAAVEAGTVARAEAVPAEVLRQPSVGAAALGPRAWCDLLGLAPDSGAGTLVWQAASELGEVSTDGSAAEDGAGEEVRSVADLRERVESADAPGPDRRAAANHLRLAERWEAVGARGLDGVDLAGPEVTVLDVSTYDDAPANAVVRAVADACYRARVEERVARLPWLLLDEAHAFVDGVAAPALERLLTRGRAPGASLVLATQRPGALPDVAISQADLTVAHRLTSERDLDALAAARPTYLEGSIAERLPAEPGEVLLVDDATESVHAARVRERATPHGGDSPRASEVATGADGVTTGWTAGKRAGETPGDTGRERHGDA